jgi:mono/diheme cytochrome c family protein
MSMAKVGARFGFIVILLVWCGWVALSSVSSADMDIQKQAKAAGVDVKNCQGCHTVALPKKGQGQNELNDAGKWLVAEKEKRGAAKVDGAWMKDYPGAKK